jgi:protein OS-9
MTMTDSIMFVKETKTCSYILVINTPRLCGEPGFKSRIDQRDAALIRCRQVVDAATLANADSSLPEADHPFSQRRHPIANHPPLDAAEALSGAGVETNGGDASQTDTGPDAKDNVGAYDHNDLLRRALEAVLQKTGNPQGNDAGTTPRVVVEDIGNGEMVIEFISEIETNDGGGDAQRRVVDDLSKVMDSKVFEDALRAAGFDVRDEEVEVEVEVGTDAEGEEGGQRKGRRTTNGAAKGRRRANAHVERDEL